MSALKKYDNEFQSDFDVELGFRLKMLRQSKGISQDDWRSGCRICGTVGFCQNNFIPHRT